MDRAKPARSVYVATTLGDSHLSSESLGQAPNPHTLREDLAGLLLFDDQRQTRFVTVRTHTLVTS